MSVVATLAVIAIIALLAYDGVRSGLFAATYSLVRNVLAFVLAMTFCEPVMHLLSRLFSDWHPGPLYYRAIGFAAIFGFVFLFGRWLKITYTDPVVPTYPYADYIGGGAVGVLNGIVLAGVLLVLWSMMPFAKFLPQDFGRVRTEKLPVDAGSLMLRFYSHCTRTMGGSRTFLLHDEPVLVDEDLPLGVPDRLRDIDGDREPDPVPGESFEDRNGNGKWDRGWLWRYRTHADFHVQDVYDAAWREGSPAPEGTSR